MCAQHCFSMIMETIKGENLSVHQQESGFIQQNLI